MQHLYFSLSAYNKNIAWSFFKNELNLFVILWSSLLLVIKMLTLFKHNLKPNLEVEKSNSVCLKQTFDMYYLSYPAEAMVCFHR